MSRRRRQLREKAKACLYTLLSTHVGKKSIGGWREREDGWKKKREIKGQQMCTARYTIGYYTERERDRERETEREREGEREYSTRLTCFRPLYANSHAARTLSSLSFLSPLSLSLFLSLYTFTLSGWTIAFIMCILLLGASCVCVCIVQWPFSVSRFVCCCFSGVQILFQTQIEAALWAAAAGL